MFFTDDDMFEEVFRESSIEVKWRTWRCIDINNDISASRWYFPVVPCYRGRNGRRLSALSGDPRKRGMATKVRAALPVKRRRIAITSDITLLSRKRNATSEAYCCLTAVRCRRLKNEQATLMLVSWHWKYFSTVKWPFRCRPRLWRSKWIKFAIPYMLFTEYH